MRPQSAGVISRPSSSELNSTPEDDDFLRHGVEQFQAGEHVGQRDLVRRKLVAEEHGDFVSGDLHQGTWRRPRF
jgi:hypothetical protein